MVSLLSGASGRQEFWFLCPRGRKAEGGWDGKSRKGGGPGREVPGSPGMEALHPTSVPQEIEERGLEF